MFLGGIDVCLHTKPADKHQYLLKNIVPPSFLWQPYLSVEFRLEGYQDPKFPHPKTTSAKFFVAIIRQFHTHSF